MSYKNTLFMPKKRIKEGEKMYFRVENEIFSGKVLQVRKKAVSLHSQKRNGKSYTASSLRILQGLTAAKVAGCSGAI